MPRTSLLANGRAGTELAPLDSPLDAGSSMPRLLYHVRGNNIQQYLLKMLTDFVQDRRDRVGTDAMGFYSEGERLGSSSNTARMSRNI